MDSANIEQLELLKDRIEFDESVFEDASVYETTLNQLLDDSKYIALSLRYPFRDYSNMEVPKKYLNWQIRCAVELFGLIGKENIKEYSENGLRWVRDSSNLSRDLYQEIMPKVGVIGDDEDD